MYELCYILYYNNLNYNFYFKSICDLAWKNLKNDYFLWMQLIIIYLIMTGRRWHVVTWHVYTHTHTAHTSICKCDQCFTLTHIFEHMFHDLCECENERFTL